jgi:hypothetical protein
MRKINWLLAAAILCSPVAAWAGDQDFTLVNHSGMEINSVYVSKHSTSSWEEDVMGRDTLGNNQSVRISFTKGERGCYYDLRVDYSVGGNDQWPNINLCRVTMITLHRDSHGEVQARAE